MKRISFNLRFANNTGDDLIPGKIHTIRENYDYWKHFEGKEVALFTWKGKPYGKGSKQKVFCVKKIVSVQIIGYSLGSFYTTQERAIGTMISINKITQNDGFKTVQGLRTWFSGYKSQVMAIIHFTDLRYYED